MSLTKYEKMTQEPVRKLVCELAAPSIVVMLVLSLYNMADTFFVSSLGTSATAAVGVTFGLMNVIMAVGFFFGQGSGNSIARALGAQKKEYAAKMASTGFFTAFFIGVILAIVGTIFLLPLAKILGSTPTILPYSMDYIRLIVISSPFMITSYMLNTLLRFQGSAVYGMIGMCAGAVLNIGLDPLFIFVFDMGIIGAGLATLIGQIFSFTLLLWGCTRGENLRISIRNFKPGILYYKEIVRGGTPSLLRNVVTSLSTILLNQAAGGFGDAAIAAISITTRIAMMASSAMIGLGQGFQPVCGFNYGAKNYDRVKSAFKFTVITATLFLIVVATICYIYAPEIIALFRKDDPDVIAIGTVALRAQALTIPLNAWITISNMMMQTMGKAIPASILAFSRQGLFLIPVLYILLHFMGLTGIQICTPISDVCAFILAIPLVINVWKRIMEPGKQINSSIES